MRSTFNLTTLLMPVLAGSLSILSFSCGKSDDKAAKQAENAVSMKLNLMRLEGAATQALRTAATKANLTQDSEFLTTSVKIESLKYPIANVVVSNADPQVNGSASGNLNFEAYKCSATTVEGCLVDLAAGDALSNLLGDLTGVTVGVGTYTAVSVGMCPEGVTAADTYFKLKAETVIAGTTYYTNATSGLSATGPAEEIQIKNGGGCSSSSFLASPLVITADGIEVPEDAVVLDEEGKQVPPAEITNGIYKGTLAMRLYFDLEHAAYASGGTSNSGAGAPTNGCFGPAAQTPYVCVNFPKVIGTIDGTTPTVTRMLLNDHTIWGFYQGGGDVPFGAYQRVYHKGDVYTGSLPETFMSADFKAFTKNSNGTLKVETYNDGRTMSVSEFKLEDHTGTIERSGKEEPYTAVKM
jgi:hypothetical protein